MESGVQSSLHPNCHRQIIHAKFHPPYEREMWNYEKAKVHLFKRSIGGESLREICFRNTSVNNNAHKLLDPKTTQKLHWSILKTFLNNEKFIYFKYHNYYILLTKRFEVPLTNP